MAFEPIDITNVEVKDDQPFVIPMGNYDLSTTSLLPPFESGFQAISEGALNKKLLGLGKVVGLVQKSAIADKCISINGAAKTLQFPENATLVVSGKGRMNIVMAEPKP